MGAKKHLLPVHRVHGREHDRRIRLLYEDEFELTFDLQSEEPAAQEPVVPQPAPAKPAAAVPPIADEPTRVMVLEKQPEPKAEPARPAALRPAQKLPQPERPAQGGRCVLISGGDRGIGAAAARRFYHAGYRVAVLAGTDKAAAALRDDLAGNESYFIVEIKSLKRILDAADGKTPILCFVDEVLRGTNTIERIAASSRILAALRKAWVLPFAATHDIELSYILDSLYENYHFEEEVREKEVVFSYILQKGRTTSRNAIQLLDMLGYDPKIVKGARGAAADFEKNGVWDTLSQ